MILPCKNSGGGTELTYYTTYTLSTGGTPSGSYTMPKDGYVFASMNCAYGSSGYVICAVNSSYIINTGSRGSFWAGSAVKAGDVISWAQNSQQPSQVSIYYSE